MPLQKGLKHPDRNPCSPLVYVVSHGYLRTMGTGIRGRDSTWDDGPKFTGLEELKNQELAPGNDPRNGSWKPFELVISFKPQVGTALEDLIILVRCGAV